jgi:phosphoribosylanthranilate isomerase
MYIKICCICSISEAAMAISKGAVAIGLVSEMPSGPGVISDETIREISKFAEGKADTFLLTSRQNSAEIISQLSRYHTTTVQIVDELLEGTYRDIKNEFDKVRIVQVVHVEDERSVERAVLISGDVDALLLDSGAPGEKIKKLGGTGRTHNWELSRRIVENVDVPVFLAGGLNSENVCEAIQMVRPYGVDVCSGVRTDQKLDEHKLNSFVKNVSQCVF